MDDQAEDAVVTSPTGHARTVLRAACAAAGVPATVRLGHDGAVLIELHPDAGHKLAALLVRSVDAAWTMTRR